MGQLIRYYKAKKRPLSANKALMLVGMSAFSKANGIRQLKSNICVRYSYRTWERLESGFKVLNEASKNSQPFGFVKDVESTLREFKPFRLDNVNQSKL